ncbi:psbB mRNA maturation factor Mbb1, chloroplastic-like [Selaginella moellendorffii]|uniref:psbB mRNA maturation factor Mbb1, chloroplastic-like n=1 Tax=Selaginella moellendorffii TaxID=88036 RepID=UPI000D1C4798|nr:psbB mRNA maturation factor Mbb1, chloroplastic-like [Selaginella moellendorffii]|eukprot:XP_024522416.1 psbB mRNA maturation factor Mbb1, chloroplastic-like [Selaginella moellendorffii]
MGLCHLSSGSKNTGGFVQVRELLLCVEHRIGADKPGPRSFTQQQHSLCHVIFISRPGHLQKQRRIAVQVRFSAGRDGINEQDFTYEADRSRPLRLVTRPLRSEESSPESLQEIRQLIGSREVYVPSEAEEAQILEQVSRIKQQALRGSLAAAHSAIQQLYAKFPNHTRVLVEYAYIEARKGNQAAAASLFSRAITIFEETGNLNYDYVLTLQGWGSSEARASNSLKARVLFEESIRAAEKLQDHSERAIVYGLHAWALVEDKVGNWSQARELLQRAAAIQPGNAVVHQSRALMEARAHNYSLARSNFRLAVKADSHDAKCWQAWALFEASQRKFREMRQLFYRAYLVNTNDLYTLQAWAHQEALIGTTKSKNRARKLYQRCVEISPENIYSWQSWGLLEERSGNHQGARVLYEQGLRIDPSSVPCLQAYARLEKSQGNIETSRKLLQAARKIDPHNAPSLMESGLIELELGNNDVAREFFKRARKIDREKSRIKKRMFISRKTSRLQSPGNTVKFENLNPRQATV